MQAELALQVKIRVRGGKAEKKITVSKVINCTGPNTDLRYVKDPLITQLIDTDLISIDAHGLGICVDESLGVRNSEGLASSWLSYVGPMLKADYWEATAVPELRQYARNLAIRIADKFRGEKP
jgi:uncharacterized NAD(P)/FAD-binding protein YdhS